MNKIVFFIGSLGGGGAERVTIQLADYFCNKGCKVYFLAFSKENSNYIVNKNVMVTYLPVSENKIYKEIFVGYIAGLCCFIRIRASVYILKQYNW